MAVKRHLKLMVLSFGGWYKTDNLTGRVSDSGTVLVVACRSRDVKRFVVRLMYLLDIFYSKSHRCVNRDDQRGHSMK